MLLDSINKAVNQLSALPAGDSFKSFTKEIVEIIKTNLDCYFVFIFLLNDQKDFLVFSVGNGAVGDKLVEVGLTISADYYLVKYTVLGGHISLVNTVKQIISVYEISEPSLVERKLRHRLSESIFLSSPLLPETKWRLFLPLKNEDGVLGILELQSSQENGFDTDHFLSLQKLADVVAAKLDINEAL